MRKTAAFHLLEGPDKERTTKKEEENKAQRRTGIEPVTS